MWHYEKCDTPLGLPLIAGKLPKCIAICNLSGTMGFFHSESVNLARIVCLAPDEVQPRVRLGIQHVLDKAAELDASVLVCFCSPFQTGVDRAHWELRTVRKLRNGGVKDGECCFAISDQESKTVPCTRAEEPWPEQMFVRLLKRFDSVCRAVSIDPVSGDDVNNLSRDALESMLQVLKTGRQRMIEDTRKEKQEMTEKWAHEKTELEQRCAEAESNADARVAKVIEAGKRAEQAVTESHDALKEHNNTMMLQLATSRKEATEVKAALSALKLERENEIKLQKQREELREKETSSTITKHMRQASSIAQEKKAIEKKRADETRELSQKLAAAQKQVESLKKAAALVSASADEARREVSDLKEHVKQQELDLEESKQRASSLEEVNSELTEAVAELKTRLQFFSSATERSADTITQSKAELSETAGVVNDLRQRIEDKDAEIAKAQEEHDMKTKELCDSHHAEIDKIKAEARPTKDELAAVDRKRKEVKRELEQKDHLIQEQDKRCRSLDCRLRESDEKLRNAHSKLRQFEDARKHAAQRPEPPKGPPPIHPQMQQQMQQQMQFTPASDPMFECSVTQLYATMNTIVHMARSAANNSRAADCANAKLEALLHTPYVAPVAFDSES
jgi:chromosome segregation ATPase